MPESTPMIVQLTTQQWELRPTALPTRSSLGWFIEQIEGGRPSLKGLRVDEIAAAIAKLVIVSGRRENFGRLTGDKLVDYTIDAIAIHEDTVDTMIGFWPLVQAVRKRQRELSFAEAHIFTHSGEGRFAALDEPPVTLLQRQ